MSSLPIHLSPFWRVTFTNKCRPQAIMPTQPFIYIPKGQSSQLCKRYRKLTNKGKCLFKAYIKATGLWLPFTGINLHQLNASKCLQSILWDLLSLNHEFWRILFSEKDKQCRRTCISSPVSGSYESCVICKNGVSTEILSVCSSESSSSHV